MIYQYFLNCTLIAGADNSIPTLNAGIISIQNTFAFRFLSDITKTLRLTPLPNEGVKHNNVLLALRLRWMFAGRYLTSQIELVRANTNPFRGDYMAKRTLNAGTNGFLCQK